MLGKYWATGKIIYDYGNWEEKILEENDVMGILELFKNNSLREGHWIIKGWEKEALEFI